MCLRRYHLFHTAKTGSSRGQVGTDEAKGTGSCQLTGGRHGCQRNLDLLLREREKTDEF